MVEYCLNYRMEVHSCMIRVFLGNINMTRWWTMAVLLCVLFLTSEATARAEDTRASHDTYTAVINITYKDPVSGSFKTEKNDIGRYGQNSRIEKEWGWVVHVRTADNKTHGCTPPVNVPRDRWIALVSRGGCKFTKKILNAAVIKNASAVVIYNHEDDNKLLTMDHKVDEVVSIFISKADGERVAQLVDNGTRVLMEITVGRHEIMQYSSINKTSVLFVSISFIVLMIISLAWLVFYYIQRFRYAHAKERLSKRLMNAAKKAITKMPLRTLRSGDRETDSDFDQCAVCIEPYRPSDVIRILPCKHVFHKSCVDPWLIEQRSCPMCKLDILKAYGLQIQGSRESVHIDFEGASTSVGPSDMVHGRTSSQLEDGAVGGVEMVGVQPAQAQVEYHPHRQEPPNLSFPSLSSPTAESCGMEQVDMEKQPLQPASAVAADSDSSSSSTGKCRNKVVTSESMESMRSTDSDVNELQSLMPKHVKETKAHCSSDNEDEMHDAT